MTEVEESEQEYELVNLEEIEAEAVNSSDTIS
jgi:hypothetical protein